MCNIMLDSITSKRARYKALSNEDFFEIIDLELFRYSLEDVKYMFTKFGYY